MRFRLPLLLSILGAGAPLVGAFTATPGTVSPPSFVKSGSPGGNDIRRGRRDQGGPVPVRRRTTPTTLTLSSTSTTDEDCGCSDTVVFEGEPSDRARNLNAREAVRSHPLYDADGQKIVMDDLIGPPDKKGKPSIVVFLRSLG